MLWIFHWMNGVKYMNNKIYVVSGSSGSYSDATEWNVAAYFDKILADQHAEKAQQWFNENEEEYCRRSWKRQQEMVNPYDRGMYIIDDSVYYSVAEINILSEVPKP